MAKFKRQMNGYIYLVQWISSDIPFKPTTGVKLSPDQWDAEKELPTDLNLKTTDGIKVVDILAKFKGAMASARQEVKITRKDLKTTFYSHLKGEVIRGSPMAVTSPSVLEYFEMRVKEFEADKKSNCKSYRTTYKNFLQFVGKKRPTFDDLTLSFYEDFRRFLEKTKDYKKNMVAGQVKNLKMIVGEAYRKKLTANNDFKEFKAGREPAVNVFLNLAELDKIYNLYFKEKHSSYDRVRDSFIVASFTGLRFKDWGRVRSDFIVNGMLRIQSAKTNEVSQIPIHKYVKAILDKYDGVMPEQISNQKTNDAIKIVCRCARLNQSVEKPYTKGGKRKSKPDVFKKWQMCSTHTARRSLCTNLILQGASPFAVMKISGHKNFESFQKYIKLDEILAGDSLKALPMFQDKTIQKPENKVKVVPRIILSNPTLQQL